jgi:hypothetical protein
LATLRDSLIEQLAGINLPDDAAAWAHRNISAKNSLTAADAKIIEERFRARLATISDPRGLWCRRNRCWLGLYQAPMPTTTSPRRARNLPRGQKHRAGTGATRFDKNGPHARLIVAIVGKLFFTH